MVDDSPDPVTGPSLTGGPLDSPRFWRGVRILYWSALVASLFLCRGRSGGPRAELLLMFFLSVVVSLWIRFPRRVCGQICEGFA